MISVLKYKRFLLLGLVLLLAAALVIACGGGEGTTEEENGEAAEETISFAMSGGYPPFNYFDENNNLVGFDVDVGKEVAARLGRTYEPVTTAWDGIIEGLRAGHYDGILGSMAITEERSEVVDFSIPYYYSGAQLIVTKDSGIESPDDLEDAVIGVATGTTFEEDARSMEGVTEVKLYEDDNQTLAELDAGRIDGVITDRVVGLNAFKEAGYDFTLAGSVLRSEEMAVAFRQEDDELREQVNEALQAMHDDGTMTQISEKWFGEDITKK